MNTVRSLAHLRSNGSVDARNIEIENALQAKFDLGTVPWIKKLHVAVEIISNIRILKKND